MSSSQFTDAAFDAAQAMDTAVLAVKGKQISPRAAADGIAKLVEVADKLRLTAHHLAFQCRRTAHGGNPAGTEQIMDLAGKVVDFLRIAEVDATATRHALHDAHGWLHDLHDLTNGTKFTF